MAIPSPFSLPSLVQATFPKKFLGLVMKGVQDMYRESYDHAKERHDHVEFAHAAAPYDRWLLADAILRNTAERFGIDVRIQPNKARNCPHSEVHIGDVVLTIHRVTDRARPPRYACYRQSLAIDNQMFLPGYEPELPSDGRCYLVLAHMPLETDHRELGLLRLGAPEANGDKYLAYMDIFVNKGMAPAPQEVIEEQAKPRLRLLQKSSGDKDGA